MNILLDFLLIGGIVVNLLILWVLVRRKEKDFSHYLLFAFFLFLLFYLLNSYATVHQLGNLYALTFLLRDPIEIAFAPLIYIYVKSIFEQDSTLIKKNWPHIVPLLLYEVFISIPFLISDLNGEYIFDYLQLLYNNSQIAFMLRVTYLLVYSILGYRLLCNYLKVLPDNFSSTNQDNLKWVERMLVGIIAIMSTDIIFSFLDYFEVISWNNDYLIFILVVIFLFHLGFYGIKQSKVLLPEFLLVNLKVNSDDKKRPDYLAGIDEAELKEIENKITTILSKDKVYLDESLTLTKFAEMIPISNKKLSLVLNHHINTSFYDLINKYRIESVKEKLQLEEFKNYTLLGIAYESGFKSKTSFNRIFKKETGLSPSEFKKSI